MVGAEDDVVAKDHAACEQVWTEEQMAAADNVEVAEGGDLSGGEDSHHHLACEAHEARGLEAAEEPRAFDPPERSN